MKNKINIAELLKDCPKGMELDCAIYDECTLRSILEGEQYPIKLQTPEGALLLTKYGSLSLCTHSKCVIFPKDKTTWEGFVSPCTFKAGDVLVSECGNIVLLSHIDSKNFVHYHCIIPTYGSFRIEENTSVGVGRYYDCVLANEQQRQIMYDKIKCSGHKYNQHTNKLEKLVEPKFHEGDWVVTSYGEVNQVITVSEDGEGFTLDDDSYFSGSWKDMYHLWTIEDAKDGDVLASDNGNIILVKESRDSSWGYRLSYHCAVLYNGTFESREFYVSPENFLPATKEQRELLFQKMKEAGYEWDEGTKTLEKLPKFKVGDKIKMKVGTSTIEFKSEKFNIIEIKSDRYIVEEVSGEFSVLPFVAQDYWELVPNKFDITTLVPFESKVLVRAVDNQFWRPAIWGIKHWDWDFCCVLGGEMWEQCIPYEGNEHLVGTTDDCDEFYKTWK